MSSPSQNVAQQETQYVIEQSDIRSIAECVISIQNKVMYCQNLDDFDTDCVARYNITSQYVHVNRLGSVIKKGSMSELCTDVERDNEKVPHRTFIITTSYSLPVEERNNMLEILEKYYSDRGNLGIVEDSKLIVPDSIVARVIPANIISNAELQDGQLAYIMQYRTPTIPGEQPINPDPDDPECPAGTVLVNVGGVWKCRPVAPLTFCQENTVWNPDTLSCEPTEEFTCTNADGTLNTNATLVQMADGTWVCLEPDAEIDCSNGVVVLNANTLKWECIKVDSPTEFKETCNTKKPGYVFSQSDLKTSAGPTLKVKTISCGRCEKPVLDKETCDMYCLPDESKLNSRTCFAGDPACCQGDDKGIYFGFKKNARTDGILDAEGKPIEINLNDVMDDYHETNSKFNCLKCKYSSLDTSKSIYPYVAVCTGNAESENIETTHTASGDECNVSVVISDVDTDLKEIEKTMGDDEQKEEKKEEQQDSAPQSAISGSGKEEEKTDDTANQGNILKPSSGGKKRP